VSGELVFYHNPRSRAMTVHWLLEELGVPYRIVPIDLQKGEHKTPQYLAINPMGKLPTIVHEGTVVTETAAILTYLADTFPQAGLAPAAGNTRRGTYLRWLFFVAGCFEPALQDALLKRPPTENKGLLGYGSYEDTLHALRTMLTPGPYVLGDTFSAADVYAGASLSWASMVGAPGLDAPVFKDYIARVTARPAFKRISGS
jgi:glutathione S-transferase